MAPRKPPKRRSYARRTYARLRRRVSSAKIPLEVAVASGVWAMTPVADGWGSPIDYVKTGNMTEIGKMLELSILGSQGGKMDIAGILNPAAPQARFWKMLIAASLMHKVRTKLVKIPMKRVPILGRYIS